MNVDPYDHDTQQLRTAFAKFPSGVATIAASIHGEPTVLVASSFTVGVSLDPPLVSFSVQRTSTTWPDLAQAASLGVSLLGSGHDKTCRQLAAKEKAGRFDGIEVSTSSTGAIFIHGSPVWMECTIEDQHQAGDHDIVVLRVTGLAHVDNVTALVFHESRFKAIAVS